MSVLTTLIQQREAWANQHNGFIARHNRMKVVSEYALMIIIGLFLYFCHERVLAFVESLLSRY